MKVDDPVRSLEDVLAKYIGVSCTKELAEEIVEDIINWAKCYEVTNPIRRIQHTAFNAGWDGAICWTRTEGQKAQGNQVYIEHWEKLTGKKL